MALMLFALINIPIWQESGGRDVVVSPDTVVWHDYDVLHINLNVEIIDTLTSVELAGSNRLTCLARASLDSVPLHLYRSIAVDSASLNGSPVPVGRTEDTLWLYAPVTLIQGDTFTATVWYQGRAALGSIGRSQGAIYSHTEPYGSKGWFPCWDWPGDKYTATLNFTADERYRISSNGVLTGVDSAQGKVTYHWSETHLLPPYLTAFSASPCPTVADTWNTTPLYYWFSAVDTLGQKAGFANVPEMLTLFSALTVYYPYADEKLAYMQGSGGMEHTNAITLSPGLVNPSYGAQTVIAHELAHMWWGDWVTCATWPNIWLNEGFATYFESLWVEQHYGNAQFLSHMSGMANAYFQEESSSPQPVYDPTGLFSATVYYKGAWVLHMLRWVMGDSAFYGALTSYANKYAEGAATTNELKLECDSAYGGDLWWFFSEWVYSMGHPRFRIDYFVIDSVGGDSVQVVVEQTQSLGPFYRMPVELVWYGASTRTDTVQLSGTRSDTFRTRLAFGLDSVRLDPNNWLLKETDYTSVGELAAGQGPPALGLSPSVTSGRVRVSLTLPAQTAYTLSLYDASGRLVRTLRQGQWDEGLVEIDLSRSPSGVYFVRLEWAGGSVGSSLILAR